MSHYVLPSSYIQQYTKTTKFSIQGILTTMNTIISVQGKAWFIYSVVSCTLSINHQNCFIVVNQKCWRRLVLLGYWIFKCISCGMSSAITCRLNLLYSKWTISVVVLLCKNNGYLLPLINRIYKQPGDKKPWLSL